MLVSQLANAKEIPGEMKNSIPDAEETNHDSMYMLHRWSLQELYMGCL